MLPATCALGIFLSICLCSSVCISAGTCCLFLLVGSLSFSGYHRLAVLNVLFIVSMGILVFVFNICSLYSFVVSAAVYFRDDFVEIVFNPINFTGN